MTKSSLQDWLQFPGSFIERLKAYGIHDSSVQVLQENMQMPFPEECEKLNVQTPALIREVLIASPTATWMFARSVFPPAVLAGKEQLANLRTQSLGSILFQDPTLTRGPFDIILLQSHMWLHEKARHFATGDLWARTSVFTIQENPLLLTEVFFPAIEKYLC